MIKPCYYCFKDTVKLIIQGKSEYPCVHIICTTCQTMSPGIQFHMVRDADIEDDDRTFEEAKKIVIRIWNHIFWDQDTEAPG